MTAPISGLELTCQQLVEFVMAYLDHDLPDHERAVFDAHLALCPACVQYLDSYQKTIAWSRATAGDSNALPIVASDIPEDFIRAVLAARTLGETTL